MKRALAVVVMTAATDPFAFLGPTAALSDTEQRKLADGEAVVRTVKSRPREVTMVAAVRIGVDGTRLVSWYRSIAQLRESPYVPEIGRFSDPPRLEDLNGLTIDPVDVDELRRCRPDDCGLKLRPPEVVELKRGFTEPRARQHEAVQTASRRMVLVRAHDYLQRGCPDGPPPPILLPVHWPQLAAHIMQYPRVSLPDTESFLYWSKEKLSGKPIVSATHVIIAYGRGAGLPSPIVVSRQIFATHYVDGAWGMTSIVPDERGLKYLVYVNQTEIDLLRGVFGGLVRSAVERQLRSPAADLLQGVRRRLEGGDPAPAAKPRN